MSASAQRADPTTGDRARARSRGTRAKTSSMTSEYMRVSVEYRIANGDSGEQEHRRPRDVREPASAAPAAIRRRSVEPAADEPRRDEREHAEDPRERADRGLVAGAEHPHPDVQEDVVERRRAVVTAARSRRWDERQPGDVDRQHLVGPEVRPGEEAQPDPDEDDCGDREDQPDRVAPGPARGSRPSRGSAARRAHPTSAPGDRDAARPNPLPSDDLRGLTGVCGHAPWSSARRVSPAPAGRASAYAASTASR